MNTKSERAVSGTEATIRQPETISLAHRILNPAWFLAWATVSSLACLSSATQLGATYDEPIYLDEGLKHWHTGSYSGLLQLGTMPLPVDVTTLPLYLWERWHGIQFDPQNDLYHILPWPAPEHSSSGGRCFGMAGRQGDS